MYLFGQIFNSMVDFTLEPFAIGVHRRFSVGNRSRMKAQETASGGSDPALGASTFGPNISKTKTEQKS